MVSINRSGFHSDTVQQSPVVPNQLIVAVDPKRKLTKPKDKKNKKDGNTVFVIHETDIGVCGQYERYSLLERA